MKSIIVIVLIMIILEKSYQNGNRFLKHNQHQKLRLRNHLKIKSMDMNKLKLNLISRKNGEYVINEKNAEDFYQLCTQAGMLKDSETEKQKGIDNFMKITQRAAKALEDGLSPSQKDDYWIYFVQTKGGCDPSQEETGLQFVVMSAGDPRDLDWGDVKNKAGFISFCQNGRGFNGGDTKDEKDRNVLASPYLLLNCAFDSCKTKKYQDKQVINDQKGNCQTEIDDEESITIQNLQKKASLKIVENTQINSFGRVIEV